MNPDKPTTATEASFLDDVDPQLEGQAEDALRDTLKLWDLAERLTYPELLPDGVQRRFVADNAPPRREPEWLLPDADGLLGALRREANSIRATLAVEEAHATRTALRLARVLYRAYSYLHDMVRQLNVIRPRIPRRYQVLDRYELADFTWRHGIVDHDSLPQQNVEEAAVSVNFVYRQGSDGKPLTFERDGSVSERFRHHLFDAGLQVDVEEIRNRHRYVERARFVVAPEIRTAMLWQIDVPHQAIQIRMQNLERLGWREVRLRPERITPALLDRLGALILGRPDVRTWP